MVHHAVSDLASVITALAALVAAVGAIVAAILGYLNRRKVMDAAIKAETAKDAAEAAKLAAEKSAREIVATREGIFTLGERIDGQLDKLLAGARAEGRAEGEQAQRDRTAGSQAPPDLR